MHIVSHPGNAVPGFLRAQVIALQEREWPAEGDASHRGRDPTLNPISLLLVDREVVVASLDILSKDIEHRGLRFSASGLSTVLTDPTRRGQGYGRRLVEAAREFLEASGVDLGLFTCDRQLAAFYVRAGWPELPGAVIVGGTPDEPFPSDQFDKVTLALFCTEHGRRHASSFGNSRIELYPGTIDKLW